tara:strand:- start:20 stop:484 length:465 start_codon:yes stop_codon:yes gene_type:complete
MGVQQELLQKLGESLVLKFRANIEQVKTSGRTAASIHAVATDDTLEVRADKHIWALEDGRKPTASGATLGDPSLFEAIKEWAQLKGIVTNINDSEQLGIVYAITRKIHNEGWKSRLNKPLSSVIDSINLDLLMRDVVAYQTTIYEQSILRAIDE